MPKLGTHLGHGRLVAPSGRELNVVYSLHATMRGGQVDARGTFYAKMPDYSIAIEGRVALHMLDGTVANVMLMKIHKDGRADFVLVDPLPDFLA